MSASVSGKKSCIHCRKYFNPEDFKIQYRDEKTRSLHTLYVCEKCWRIKEVRTKFADEPPIRNGVEYTRTASKFRGDNKLKLVSLIAKGFTIKDIARLTCYTQYTIIRTIKYYDLYNLLTEKELSLIKYRRKDSSIKSLIFAVESNVRQTKKRYEKLKEVYNKAGSITQAACIAGVSYQTMSRAVKKSKNRIKN